MPGYVIGNFFIYALINAITPGPGNILALNTVSNYGWKKVSHFSLAYLSVTTLCKSFALYSSMA